MLKTKFALMISVILLIVFTISSLATAQMGKMGYIDSDKIFAEYEDWNRAQEEFNTEYKAWEEEAKDMQATLDNDASRKLHEIQKYCQQRIDRLTYLATSTKNMSDLFINLQRAKVANNG